MTFQLHIHHLDERLDQHIEINIYRIIQETISNILKHAHATEIILQINRLEDDLLLIVEDNGTGFEIDATERPGIGLKNIQSRVDTLYGNLHIDSRKGKGTIITIEIPLTDDKNLDRG
jgi:signal transduction histidine kinase